ncbi:MAG: DUF167 domain-containing protein [Patescibacteria group bacterium]|jgi:uncharacterized protein YggU (UPF0235/DUF167 family)|nr:DUF167 domain-containing protein [Patescibacteria group bacterium]
MKISVKVKPNASINKIKKIADNQFEIFTTAPAKENKANEAVITILAEFLNIAPSRINLIKGAKSKQKIFDITNI